MNWTWDWSWVSIFPNFLEFAEIFKILDTVGPRSNLSSIWPFSQPIRLLFQFSVFVKSWNKKGSKRALRVPKGYLGKITRDETKVEDDLGWHCAVNNATQYQWKKRRNRIIFDHSKLL